MSWLYLLGEVISCEPHADFVQQWNSVTPQSHCTSPGCHSPGGFNEFPDNKGPTSENGTVGGPVTTSRRRGGSQFCHLARKTASEEEHFQHWATDAGNDSVEPLELKKKRKKKQKRG